MNLKIRTLLPLIVCALGLMAVAFAGLAARDAWIKQQQSAEFLKVNQISKLLLKSAGEWAVERGLSNASVKAPEPITPARRSDIDRRRASGDEAFRQASELLRTVPQMRAAAAVVSEAEQTFRGYSSSAPRSMTISPSPPEAAPRTWCATWRRPLPT